MTNNNKSFLERGAFFDPLGIPGQARAYKCNDAPLALQAPLVNPEFNLLSPTGHVEERIFVSVDKK